MLARVWLFLVLFVVAVRPAAAAAVLECRAAGLESSSIESGQDPLSPDFRGAERVGLTAEEERVRPVGTTGIAGAPDGTPGRGSVLAPPTHRAGMWCDVVQCRRLTGAQLLRWSTPPPRCG